jgi:hypothetical protein
MSTETEAYYIPQYLDEPERVLFWSTDEIFVMIIPIVVIGFCLNHFLYSLGISIAAVVNWKKFKGSDQAN